jgi:hypothetical protein
MVVCILQLDLKHPNFVLKCQKVIFLP